MATKQVNVHLDESDDAALIIIQKDIEKRTNVKATKAEAARSAIRERARQLVEAVKNLLEISEYYSPPVKSKDDKHPPVKGKDDKHPGRGDDGYPNRIIEIYAVFCHTCGLGIFPGGKGIVKGSRSYMNTQAWCCAKCSKELFLEADSGTVREGD